MGLLHVITDTTDDNIRLSGLSAANSTTYTAVQSVHSLTRICSKIIFKGSKYFGTGIYTMQRFLQTRQDEIC
jgi:hypothetical protein